MKQAQSVAVIGGGLAGCEAAWQLLKRGRRVILYEMKPHVFSPAHKSPQLAELVCSNSLRSNALENAVGLLKEEMRRLGSLIMEAADLNSVPAGSALAVDRSKFSCYIEDRLFSQENLEVIREEVRYLPQNIPVIIATGPLTSPALAQDISLLTKSEHLYFYDAISPIIEGESINCDRVFRASRYEDGPGDYLNCPMDKDDYERFRQALMEGRCVPLNSFEEPKCFEGCLPIEVLSSRGLNTLAFGPMKPVGLINPKTGKQPYAVVQLRQENLSASLFNMVGFQTKLSWPEQKRIFRSIPGLEEAEFFRYGSVHRNTFINSPALLKKTLQLRTDDHIFFAGQITGVEGYVESAAAGLIAGLGVHCMLSGRDMSPPPETTAHGALLSYIAGNSHRAFQPMNVNFGIFPPLASKIPKKERGRYYAERALADLKDWLAESGLSHDLAARLNLNAGE
ncbi:MAG TPA: methylenetetrahydrofolate--tRNA-(uracil(54)-C(5))-methyltransferase (FADH(2)-oxidizing) TrmFO [Syntrophales bacterium]|nr:methylenetetrahydrofolate--tRNA-(uracil(54)-C(5))-methyltransferase (FADH(2)-oxidizing) TrmFO [Syntrophales bacterium]